jgi:hypothetical protein
VISQAVAPISAGLHVEPCPKGIGQRWSAVRPMRGWSVQAARSYSWTRPPRTSRRMIRPPVADGAGRGTGWASPRPRWGHFDPHGFSDAHDPSHRGVEEVDDEEARDRGDAEDGEHAGNVGEPGAASPDQGGEAQRGRQPQRVREVVANGLEVEGIGVGCVRLHECTPTRLGVRIGDDPEIASRPATSGAAMSAQRRRTTADMTPPISALRTDRHLGRIGSKPGARPPRANPRRVLPAGSAFAFILTTPRNRPRSARP